MSTPLTECRSGALCAALHQRYPGLKFLNVLIEIASDEELVEGGELVQRILFTVSGSAADLERHRFADPSWWPAIPASGEGRNAGTEGLGRAWRVWRNKKGYRLEFAEYDDGLDRVAAVMVSALLPWRRNVAPGR